MKSPVKELLRAKRDGAAWSKEEMEQFVHGIVHGQVSLAQCGAFLMAACTRGLAAEEVAALTLSMAANGAHIPKHVSTRPAIDKHSTGGVGDKVSLLLTPLAVACGLAVPMISGRGLGHTGGTVDKLESVPGYRTILPMPQLIDLLRTQHFFMAGQSEDLAPADRTLYHVRDVTGTVENIGLLTSSILSKKFAEGLDGLVMDMKVGGAAFMPTLDGAQELARSMRSVCAIAGLPCTFVFTRMDGILGRTVGNALEVEEAALALQGIDVAPDLEEVTVELVARMLQLAFNGSIEEHRASVRAVWAQGKGYDVFEQMLHAQGGTWPYVDQGLVFRQDVVSTTEGTLMPIDGRSVAVACLHAGAGRLRETDTIDPRAGITFIKRDGDAVHVGDVLATVQASNAQKCTALHAAMQQHLQTTTAPAVQRPSMIIDVWEPS
jgi:thymidine phosphorylase